MARAPRYPGHGNHPGPGKPPKPALRPERDPEYIARRNSAKRTPAERAMILMALERGHTRAAAAAQAGLHFQRLYDWIRSDPAFAEQVDVAEGKAEVRIAEALIDSALAPGADWRAILAWLEHRRRHDWRPPTTTTEVSGPDGGAIALEDARAKVARVLDRIVAAEATALLPGKPDAN